MNFRGVTKKTCGQNNFNYAFVVSDPIDPKKKINPIGTASKVGQVGSVDASQQVASVEKTEASEKISAVVRLLVEQIRAGSIGNKEALSTLVSETVKSSGLGDEHQDLLRTHLETHIANDPSWQQLLANIEKKK